jgi:hypothetical protein
VSPFQKFPLDLIHSHQLAPQYLPHESLVQLVRDLAEIQTHYATSKFKTTQNILLSAFQPLQKLLNIFQYCSSPQLVGCDVLTIH